MDIYLTAKRQVNYTMLLMRFEPRGVGKNNATNFDEFLGFWRKFRCERTFRERNYERYFAVDASELRTQEGKFALLESSVRNFERKFTLLITAKCSLCIVVMHCRKIRNQSDPLKELFYRSLLLKPQRMFDC